MADNDPIEELKARVEALEAEVARFTNFAACWPNVHGNHFTDAHQAPVKPVASEPTVDDVSGEDTNDEQHESDSNS